MLSDVLAALEGLAALLATVLISRHARDPLRKFGGAQFEITAVFAAPVSRNAAAR
jgi:hypothetical protein